jgi:aromatic ring-opening dioxygenase catalytic subunit (LigB family)
MGNLVGAFAMSHILAGRAVAAEQAERVFEGFQEVGRRAVATRPDIILFIVSDHMANFGTSIEAPFTVGTAGRYTSLGDMDLPRLEVTGHRDFACGLAEYAAGSGFDLAVTEEIRPDHGLMIPRLFVDPSGRIPVVPLNININMTPAPRPSRCWALGQVLASYIASRPEPERVLVVATGGLSHWVMQPEMGKINETFDRNCLALLAAGDGVTLADMSAAKIEQEAGNGGLEFVNWLCMAGAAAPVGGEVIFYEPMTAWLTGMGAIAMHTKDKL